MLEHADRSGWLIANPLTAYTMARCSTNKMRGSMIFSLSVYSMMYIRVQPLLERWYFDLKCQLRAGQVLGTKTLHVPLNTVYIWLFIIYYSLKLCVYRLRYNTTPYALESASPSPKRPISEFEMRRQSTAPLGPVQQRSDARETGRSLVSARAKPSRLSHSKSHLVPSVTRSCHLAVRWMKAAWTNFHN